MDIQIPILRIHMNLPQKVTSIIIATGLAVSLASCSTSSKEETVDTKPQATQSASQTPEGKKVDVATEQKAVASTYEEFLNSVYSGDNTKLQAVADKYKGRTGEPTQAEKDQIISEVEDAVPALKYIDVEGKNADEKQKIYGPIIVLATVAAGKNYGVKVDPNQVKVDDSGEKASVNVGAVQLNVDGKDAASASSATDVSFVKKDGKWLIEPTDAWLNGSLSGSGSN